MIKIEQVTLEQVQAVLWEVLGTDPKQSISSARLVQDLDADSLDVVELMMAFEEKFDLEIEDEEIERLDTVGKIMEFLQSKVSEKGNKNVKA